MKAPYLILMALFLTACGGEEFQELRDFVKNAGADMRGKVDPPPVVKMYEPFEYNNDAALPDPFTARKPDLRSGGGRGLNQPDLDRPKEALEEFPLESLKMVGYIFKDKVGYAVVQAPDGHLHKVRTGNYVGQNFGLVESVGEAEVVIREMIQDGTGDWSERMSSLQLME